jgi:hypothetical protein
MVILGDTERRCRHDLGDDGLGKARRNRAERSLVAGLLRRRARTNAASVPTPAISELPVAYERIDVAPEHPPAGDRS